MERRTLQEIAEEHADLADAMETCMPRETCWQCGGEGGYHDCGEDCCSCLHPDEQGGEFWRVCDVCEGEGELGAEEESA